jgi:hypothetical protein
MTIPEACEMYHAEKAFDKGDIVLCEIKDCPYNNGDGQFNSFDDGIKYTICKTRGQVTEKGLIQNINEIKAIRV